MERKEGQIREESSNQSDIAIPLTIEIPLTERFIVPVSDAIRSFATMSVDIYPLRFSLLLLF